MAKLRILAIALLLTAAAHAQTYLRYSNWCQKGGQRVTMSGQNSTTKVQGSFPGCLVTVYNAGTLSKPFLFTDKLGTPLANPFTASTSDGSFAFYVNTAAHYDIVTSGAGLTAPYTVFDFVLTDIGSGGGGGSVTGVTAILPVVSSGGTAPVISMPQATAAQSGFLAAADWATFNSKGSGSVSSVQLAAPSSGFSVSGGPITNSGTLTLSYNGQFPTTSLCSGSPTNLNFCNGSGAWLPALTYLGNPVLTLTPSTNIAFTPSGNNVAISSTSAVTFPVLAPSGSSTSAQYSYTAHPETGTATALVGSQIPIEQVVVTNPTGPNNITITTSSVINPLSWTSGLTFQIASLPGTSSLNTLNGIDFTAGTVLNNQACPNGYAALACGTITFSATTSVANGTYAVTAGSVSSYAGYLVGQSWVISRLPSSTSNPARTGTVQAARRDAWVFRCGAIDDLGIDCPALRGGVAITATNAVGTGKMRVNGAHSATATSLSINKGTGAWTATSADYILIDRQNGDATLQRYRITNASVVVAANGNTTVTITPPLRTALLGGELIVTQWSRAQLGDGNGVEILGDLLLTDTALYPDGCMTIASGAVGSTGVACGAGSSVAGAVNDIQINVASAFGTDTGVFTYTPGTSTLKVRNVLVNGANAQQSRWLYTVGAVALTAGGAGTTVWGVDTDGFIKFCENNGACVRPGTGAGSGNMLSSGSPTSGQTAEFVTDAFHITGVTPTGTGAYVKGTAPTISAPKLDVLNDVNNKASITLAATVNAVAALTVTNAATGGTPTVSISATSPTEANINLNLISKGTGVVQCNGATCGGGSSSYTNLFQTDANTLTQRNSGVPQTMQIMNTYTDGSNFQGLLIGDQFIKTFRAGTGNNRNFQFGVDSSGTTKGWQVSTGTFNLSPANNATGGMLANFFQSNTLLDTNGAVFLASTATASAVNSVTIANSATGNPVEIRASGGDTNISLNLVSKGSGSILCNGASCGSGGGSGTVTNFVSGNLSPLFTTNVTTSTTIPTQSFTLIAAAANSLFGNNTAASAPPAYFTAALTALPFGREGTLTGVLHGNPTGTFSFGAVNLATDVTGVAAPASICTGSPSISTFCRGDGQWATPSGGGNVSSVPTPTTGQAAEWTGASTIKGTNVTGSGSFAKATSPLLVTPQVNTILDANGNPFLISSATASAVDSLTITNSATGNPATVSATASGTDANINFLLAPKGSGLVQFNSSIQTISAATGAWQATEGINPGLAVAGKDVFWAQSGTAHYWTMQNNGGPVQKVIGSSADINTSDFVIGSHFPATRAGDMWYYNGSTWVNFPGNNSGIGVWCEDSSGIPSWCSSPLTVAWSSIQPPASNTSLSMAGFTSTFSYTSALQNAFAWLNTTAATSAGGGTNANSPTLGLQGQVWTGSNQSDIWQWQNVLTNGVTNGASTLTFTHAGSSGLAQLSAPAFRTTSVAASTPHYVSTQATCTGFGTSGLDAICGDSVAWKMSIGGGTVIPFVGGPSAAPTSGNLASFNGTTGSLIQDTGIAAGQVPTSSAVIVSGNVVQGSGGVRGISDAGYAANTVITSAAIIASGNVPRGDGARGLVDSGVVAANVNFSTANITTGSIVTGAANTRQVADGGILLANVFHTATKVDVLETAFRCQDANANDTYSCNLSPAITAYVTGTTYWFKANTVNTGAATINFNGQGALTIKKPFGGSITADLADADIRAGQWVGCTYDGTNCQMVSQLGNSPSASGTVTSVATTSPITGGTFTTSGTIGCATCVTSAASLTSTALMTGAGSQGSQTPSATATLSAGGNMSLPGTLSVTGHVTLEAITSTGATGTGLLVFGTSPTLTTAILGSSTATTQAAKTNNTTVATTGYVDRPTPLTTGTSVTLSAPRQYFVCTSTCTITVPVPAAGYEFCVMNDDNVATVITFAAIGSSARYENTARTAYGTAGTGTLVSTAAAASKACLLGLDSTHYITASFTGSWTVN